MAITIFLFALSVFLFSKIPVELPPAVLTGFIASGVTLLGVILNNYFVAKQSDKQLSKQLIHQRQTFDEQMAYQRKALEKQLKQQNETLEKQIKHQEEKLINELQYQSDKLNKELNHKLLESEKERLFKLRSEAYREFSIECQKITIYFTDFKKLSFEQDGPSPIFLDYMNSIAQVNYLLDEKNVPLQRAIVLFLMENEFSLKKECALIIDQSNLVDYLKSKNANHDELHHHEVVLSEMETEFELLCLTALKDFSTLNGKLLHGMRQELGIVSVERELNEGLNNDFNMNDIFNKLRDFKKI